MKQRAANLAGLVAIAWLLAFGTGARGIAAETSAVTLPFVSPVFGDNMVLQRDRPNTIWGWSTPGDTVTVRIDARTTPDGDLGLARPRRETSLPVSGTADATGRWQVSMEPPAVGAECVIRVDGARHAEFRNVVVGDVWLCGGQSNMEFGLPGAKNGAAEVAAANHPLIRLYTVGRRPAYAPAVTTTGSWSVCTPESVGRGPGFSAVAYYFARKVQAETGVPIGLIEDCVGGTPAECWMSEEAAVATRQFAPALAEIAKLRAKNAKPYGNYIMHWYDEYDVGLRRNWSAADFDDAAWTRVGLVKAFSALGLEDVPAVCWLRREIELPDPLPAGTPTVRLGVVEKMDSVWVNGRFVGASSWVENPRVYSVPSSILKPGRNAIALRILKVKSKNGFLTPPEELRLVWPDGTGLALAGEWKAAVSVDARPPHPLPLGYENYPTMPTVLYNGMIHPIAPLAIRGALWYQGEANASRAFQYRSLLPAMIRDWRRAFGQGDFPFLLVSLPAFQRRKAQPGTDDWAELREAQAITAATVANCGLAVTIDTGEAENIHPVDKQPVGDRLALLALAKVYGKSVPCEGPTYRSMERLPHAIRIHFDHVDGGLAVRGETLGEFSIAGGDRKWHWAKATIVGDAVVVSSPEVPEPEAVRYAWQANPEATLCNGAGLPAAPFRTDDWPGVTNSRLP